MVALRLQPSLDYGVIDIHIHVAPWEMMHAPILAQMQKNRQHFEFLTSIARDAGRLIGIMDEAGIARAGIINYVAPEIMGFTFEANRFSADYVKQHRDRLFAHGSIDPIHSKDPEGELSLLLDEWGIAAIKIHPPHQGIAPNAYLEGNTILPTVYEGCSRRGVPVVLHTGTTIFKGARIKYGDPILIDDVACDFPDLKIVLAHAGRPLWTETARFLVKRHPHVYMDLSGIPPQRIPRWFPDLDRLADKVLWGTDWPGPGVPDMGTNLRAFLKQDLDQTSLRRMLRDNALKLFYP
ncbi:MAG: amidohydrolase [candidate division Zixibacteria bacterium]|nr:amidohydrolase [candidate division Zixibacteria bacterium]